MFGCNWNVTYALSDDMIIHSIPLKFEGPGWYLKDKQAILILPNPIGNKPWEVSISNVWNKNMLRNDGKECCFVDIFMFDKPFYETIFSLMRDAIIRVDERT